MHVFFQKGRLAGNGRGVPRRITWMALGIAVATSSAGMQARPAAPPATVPVQTAHSAAAAPATVLAPAPEPNPADVVQRDYYYSTYKAQRLLERFVPSGALLLFGDSQIQGLDTESLHPNPANFGITGDTSAGLAHRIRSYKSVQTASSIVLGSGINDLSFGQKFDRKIESNYTRILSWLPPAVDIYLLGIFPVNEQLDPALSGYNKRIKNINSGLARLCRHAGRCVFVNVNARLVGKDGNTSKRYLRPKDAVHLNDAGKEIVLAGLRASMKTQADGKAE